MKRCPQCSTEYADTTQFCPHDGLTLEAADPIVGRVIGGRYRVISRVGRGGMGAVYRGEHLKMRRITAIKVLTPALAGNPEFVARFQREAELASTINHPHAVGIYDFGEDDGLVYLAMEFLDGEPLSAILSRRGTLPLELAVRVARQAAEALDAAHRRGIIHRDFKPDNVMLCGQAGEPPVVKVVDFGIAKQTDLNATAASLTQTGSVLGTPTYMSPEQAADRPLDPRSDLYSLALTVYQMLAGTLPFRGDTAQAIMVMRLLEPPTPLRTHAPAVPPSVEAVVMRALAKEPFGRQPTVLQFAAELEHAATTTQAVPAAPSYPTPSYPPPAISTPPASPPPNYQTPPAGAPPTNNYTPQAMSPAYGATPVMSAPVYAPTPPYTVTAAVPPKPRRTGAILAALLGVVVLVVGAAFAVVVYRATVAQQAPADDPNAPPMADSAKSIPYLAQLSRDLREQEKYEEAEAKARDAVKLDPKSPIANAALSDALLDQSKVSEARVFAERAAEADRNSAVARRALGSFLLADRQFDRAIDESKAALQLRPGPEDEALAHITLGAAYVEKNLWDAASAEFNQAKSYGGRHTIQVLARLGLSDVQAGTNRPEAGIADLQQLAADPKTLPNLRAAVNMRIAKLLLVQTKPADAVTYCDKALETATLRGVRSAALVIKGLAQLYLQKPDDAVKSADEALTLGGDDRQLQAYAYAVKGMAAYLKGRVDEARDMLRKAQTLLPNDPDIADLAKKAGVKG